MTLTVFEGPAIVITAVFSSLGPAMTWSVTDPKPGIVPKAGATLSQPALDEAA